MDVDIEEICRTSVPLLCKRGVKKNAKCFFRLSCTSSWHRLCRVERGSYPLSSMQSRGRDFKTSGYHQRVSFKGNTLVIP